MNRRKKVSSSRLGKMVQDDSKEKERSPLTFQTIVNKGNHGIFRENLIYGYVRKQYEQKQKKQIPVELIRLIIFFYQDGFEWKFNKEEIATFDGAQSERPVPILKSDVFQLHGANFRYTLSPDGDLGEMDFQFQCESTPKELEYMEIYIELRCVETGNMCKGTKKFGQYLGGPNLFRLSGILISDIVRKHYNSLTFVGVVDVLCCRYRNNHRMNNDPRVMNLTKMSRFGNIEWSPPNEYLYTITIRGRWRGKTRIFSDSFCRDVFCLTCMHNSTDTYCGGVRIQNEFGIELLKMPAMIKKLELKYQFSIYTKSKLSAPKLKKKWSRSVIALSGWTMTRCVEGEYEGKVTVKCAIRVIKAFDWDERVIDHKDWHSVGIL